jgi:hypothetical protein
VNLEKECGGEAPFSVNVPNTLKNIFFIEKNSKRFPDSSGWGYALFNYDAASDTFTPDGSYSHLSMSRPSPWLKLVSSRRSGARRS